MFVFYFIPFHLISLSIRSFMGQNGFPGTQPTDDIVFMRSEPITLRRWTSSLPVPIYTAVHVPFFSSFPFRHHVVCRRIQFGQRTTSTTLRHARHGQWAVDAIHNTKAPTASDNSGSTVDTLGVITLQYINRYDANVYGRKVLAAGLRRCTGGQKTRRLNRSDHRVRTSS